MSKDRNAWIGVAAQVIGAVAALFFAFGGIYHLYSLVTDQGGEVVLLVTCVFATGGALALLVWGHRRESKHL